MKKLLAIVLAAVMVLSLAACGGGGGEQPVVPGHDPVTYIHSTKGEPVEHNFVDGKCTRCDTTSIFFQDKLDKHEASSYVSSTPGQVIEFYYDTRAYYVEEYMKAKEEYEDPGEIHIQKRAFAYLPNGYDESKKYNVLYLLHGSGLNEGFWFAKGTFNPQAGNYTGGYFTDNVLNYLFDKGLAEDTIIITPSLYSARSYLDQYDGSIADADATFFFLNDAGEKTEIITIDNNNSYVMNQFYRELENDLMPYVAENFATYAASGSLDDLIAARDHQGYAGLSLGSMTGYQSVWMQCLDVFSYIGNFSGGPMGVDITTQAETLKQYPMNFWYVGEGTDDSNKTGLGNFIKWRDLFGFQDGSDVANGDNCAYMVVNGG
ncbi:MAG: hypothetical protein IKA97_03095, partial [Clostridia bacterium]|nr:hypothetical protein [Clostridia bacterium]